MSSQERVDTALELMRHARQHIHLGDMAPDPVKERIEHATAAQELRKAADLLDDEGRLQP